MIALDAVQLYDMGFGPRMVPVAPPGVPIAPGSSLKDKSLGRAPGKLTLSGWVGVDLNDPKTRCHDYQTAALWRDEWHANVGLVGGEGLVIVDNDQGAEFSTILHDAFQAIGVLPLRRYVQDPKHHRDAWLFQVRDFIGEPVSFISRDLTFRNGVQTARVQVLAKGKQLVVAGVHRDTKAPYVLDRPLSFDELPVLSEDQLKAFFDVFDMELARLGWAHDSGPVSLVSRPALQPGTIRNLIPLTSEQIDSAIGGAAALLTHLPNREMPADKKDQTKADLWLHGYDNWIKIAYALIAHLGAAAVTPQARNLWLEWALARPQEQDPAEVWDSALRQPLRYGGRGLIQLLQSIDKDVLPPTPFPDPDPNDPTFKMPPARTAKTPLWDMLKSKWAYLALNTGWFLNLETGIPKHPSAFSGWLAPDRKALMKELGIKPKKGEHMSIASIFCDQSDKLVYHDLIYAPGDPRELPDGVFNRWKQTAIRPQIVHPDRIRLWLDHVFYVLGGEADRFIEWCAFLAQRPDKKPNWHFLIMTQQGVGKDRMMRPVEFAVGEGNYQHADVSVFYGNFNGPLETKLLVISEMNKNHSDAQARHANDRLKLALAAPPEMIPINIKYRPHYDAKNRLGAVIFANSSEPLVLERNQRRVHVVNQLHVKLETPDYYDALAKWLEANNEENAKLVASYLLALPLPDDKTFLGTAPNSDDKAELEERNVDVGLQLLEEIIEEVRQAGNPTALLTTASLLAGTITGRGVRVTPPQVSGWLRDMERAGRGVERVRTDPKRPSVCGVVSYDGRTARLWSLSEKHPKNGRPWKDISNSDLLDIQNGKDVKLPPLGSSNVTPFPATVDEKV